MKNGSFKGWWLGLLVLSLLYSAPTRAQEHPMITYPFYTPQDSSAVFKLVQQGVDLIDKNIDSAIILFKKAEQISRKANFQDGIGYAMAYIGLAETQKGNYKKGFAYYKEAFPYCLQATRSKFVIAYLYMNIGISWKNKGNFLKANEYYHKALTGFEKYLPGNKSIIVAYINLIGIQGQMGSYDNALLYANKAIHLAKIKNKKQFLALATLNKGGLYYTMGQFDNAMQCYQQGLKLVNELKDTPLYQSYALSIGNVMLKKKKYKDAIYYFKKAISFNTAASKPLTGFILPRYSLGAALLGSKRYREAEQVLLSALKKAQETGLTQNEHNGHGVLSVVYERMGEYEKALAQLQIFLVLRDSLNKIEKIRAINEVDAKYQVAQKDKELVQKQLKITQQQKKLTEKNLVLAGTGGGILLLSVLGFAFYRYQRKIRTRESEIKQLKAIMAGEEKERARLSRELHDGLGGMLTGIKMNLRTLQKQGNVTALPENLNGIMDMLQDMGEEIHKTARNLMPDILLKHNLEQALQLYCQQLNTGELQLNLQFHETLPEMDKSLELALYRIIQELIQNMIKHAHASRAAIQVRQNGNILCIAAEDNGMGFDPKAHHKGMGLQNIEARVKALNGYYALSSVPGRGTTAYIEIDLKKNQQYG